MLVGCPQCKTRYRIDDEKVGAEGVKLRCTNCRTIFRVLKREPVTEQPVHDIQPPVTPPAQGADQIRVAIANESIPFCEAVKKVLAQEHFSVITYNDGAAALQGMKETSPHVALLDVALPGMYGFELCEALKRDSATAGVKVILIASIYDKTRYKRSPITLYGADDYIEKHHIPDELAAKIYALVSGQKSEDTAPEERAPAEDEASVSRQELSPQEEAAQEEVRLELKRDEENETVPAAPPVAPAELSDAQKKAKRLARIIVSDIALYNQSLVEEGVKNGTLYQLLENDIQEGRAHYLQRVSEEIRNNSSYLEEAFEELIAKKKREMGI